MPSEDSKALEFKQYQKFDKASFIIYADLQCLIEKTHDVFREKKCMKKFCESL